ncbi:Mu transposase C-terminal domain-containing protein [Brevibacillus laterosporus]|uniref:Mu transposase C-terminal domain-containing protein n=1 Tax=Brevibacillus laterosporus TaxID=1465 RepID=UPI002E1C9B8D|nr:DDE-type integrase/transposase/recombinase [Brevibacillus laterosporus]
MIKRVEGDGESIEINFVELVTNPSFKAGKTMLKEIERDNTKFMSLLDSLSEAHRKKVSERLQMIKALLVLERVKRHDIRAMYEFMMYHRDYLSDGQTLNELTQEELIRKISQRYSAVDEDGGKTKGASVRTIKRLLSAYRQAESEDEKRGEEGLISRAGGGYVSRTDNKQLVICHPKKPDEVLQVLDVRIDEKYISIIKEVIEKEFLNLKRMTKQAFYESVALRCTRQGIEEPKRITLLKLLDRIDSQIKVRMRDGSKAAKKFDDLIRGFSNEEAQYPLHIVEIDHTELDIDVIDGNSGLVIGRPWITLGIDVYSRMVWCMYVSFEPPSANVVRKAIQQGVFFKRVKEKYDLFNEWEVFGIPTVILLDNGKEFRSVAVRRIINETLKSNVRYRPRKTPEYGAAIERLFGTLNSKLIHRLDGTRKSSVSDLGEYKPDEEAVFTVEDIRELLTMYIVEHYHMEPHRGLPLNANRPITRFVDGLKKVGYPDFVSPEEEEMYAIELLPVATKPYTRDGVRIDNRLYKLDKLSHLIGPRTTKYKVKYDIDDISRVYIQPPNSTEYIEVPAVLPPAEELEGMNAYTYKVICEISKEEATEKANKIPGTKMIRHAKVKLQQRVQEKIKSGRKARQLAQRAKMEITVGQPHPLTLSKRTPSLEQLADAVKLEAKRRKEGVVEHE